MQKIFKYVGAYGEYFNLKRTKLIDKMLNE